MSKTIIETENLSKIYSTGKVKTTALQDVNIKIQQGSFSCIVGPSGHGKSTLLHLLGGLDKPTAGKVLVNNTDIAMLNNNELADFRLKQIGFVFQFFNLLPQLTALENVQIAMMLNKISETKQTQNAKQLLTDVGLEKRLHHKPAELSGGEQQRVAIARALANKAEILLMDEPTGNLDSTSEKIVLENIIALNKKGITVLIVTHNLTLAKQAENIFTLKDGKTTD